MKFKPRLFTVTNKDFKCNYIFNTIKKRTLSPDKKDDGIHLQGCNWLFSPLFLPGVACSITTRPKTTSTLLSLTAPGYVANFRQFLQILLKLMKWRSELMRCLSFLQPFCSLIQIHGHNRARQRDKLGHILEEFATLQDEVSARLYLYWLPFLFSFFFSAARTRQRLQSLSYSLCSTGREGGRRLAQPADETGAAAAASSLPRHLDLVSQPANYDPVLAQWLWAGAVQHAWVLLHLLVRLDISVLHTLTGTVSLFF